MKYSIVLAFCFFALQVSAQERVSFEITGIDQSCKRADTSKPFECRATNSTPETIQIDLKSVTPDSTVEESAFEGASADAGMSFAQGQYLYKVTVRKSTSLAGASIIYEVHLSAHQMTADSSVTIYETTLQGHDNPPADPLMLALDRDVRSDRYFSEASFILKLSGASK